MNRIDGLVATVLLLQSHRMITAAKTLRMAATRVKSKGQKKHAPAVLK